MEVPQVTLTEEIVERSVTEYVEVIKEGARNETRQVQKQVTKPELELFDKIDEVPLT